MSSLALYSLWALGLALLLIGGFILALSMTSSRDINRPPSLATTGLITASATIDIPLSPAELRASMEANPITDYLKPRGRISSPTTLTPLLGTWPEPGATRRIDLADGNHIIERIVSNEPGRFSYQIFQFSGIAALSIDQIVGEQRFIEIETGTRIEWDYAVKPRHPIFRPFVQGNIPDFEIWLSSGLEGFAEAVSPAN